MCVAGPGRAPAARIPGGGGHTRLAAEGICLGVAALGRLDGDPACHTRPTVTDLQRRCAASPPPPQTPPTARVGRVAGAPYRRSIQTGPRRATASRRASSPTPPARHRRSPENRWGLNGVVADALGLAFGPPPRLPSVARDTSDSGRLRWLWAGDQARLMAHRPQPAATFSLRTRWRAPAPALPLTRPAGGGRTVD